MRVANIYTSVRMKSSFRSNSKLVNLAALSIVLFVLLSPVTLIIAQNGNESFFDPTGNVIADPQAENQEIPSNGNPTQDPPEIPPEEPIEETTQEDPVETPVEILPETPPEPENNEALPEENITIELPPIEESTNENITIEIPENITEPVNITHPENETQNITTPENEIGPENITENETIVVPINITNQTPKIAEPIESPAISLGLELPEKITRGETFQAIATVRNDGLGNAESVLIRWALPESFQITSGSEYHECKLIEPGAFCQASVEVFVSYSADLGKSNIGVRASYD